MNTPVDKGQYKSANIPLVRAALVVDKDNNPADPIIQPVKIKPQMNYKNTTEGDNKLAPTSDLELTNLQMFRPGEAWRALGYPKDKPLPRRKNKAGRYYTPFPKTGGGQAAYTNTKEMYMQILNWEKMKELNRDQLQKEWYVANKIQDEQFQNDEAEWINEPMETLIGPVYGQPVQVAGPAVAPDLMGGGARLTFMENQN